VRKGFIMELLERKEKTGINWKSLTS
jgi:hypothetical protein